MIRGCVNSHMRGCGGIGRRARFRFWCPRRAGSSPVTRITKYLEYQGIERLVRCYTLSDLSFFTLMPNDEGLFFVVIIRSESKVLPWTEE